MQTELNEMLEELVSSVLKIFSEQIISIILYGSTARGVAKGDSDIDIAMLVKRGLSKADEDQLSDIVVDLNLKYDKVFSVIDIEYEHFKKWENVTPFYRNMKNDGVVLWTAA